MADETRIVQFCGGFLTVLDESLSLLACGTFRSLGPDEVADFRAHARLMPKGVTVDPVWHPIVQDELLTSGRGVTPSQAETLAETARIALNGWQF